MNYQEVSCIGAGISLAVLTFLMVTVKIKSAISDLLYIVTAEFAILLGGWAGAIYIINDFKYEMLWSCFVGIGLGLLVGLEFWAHHVVVKKLHPMRIEEKRRSITVVLVFCLGLLSWFFTVNAAWKFYADNSIIYAGEKEMQITMSFEYKKIGGKAFFIADEGKFRKEIPQDKADVIEGQLEYGVLDFSLHNSMDWSIKFEKGKVLLNDTPLLMPMFTGRKILVLTQLEQALDK